MEFKNVIIKNTGTYQMEYDLSCFGKVQVLKDIPYSNKYAADKMDLYIPENAVKPMPLIVYIHGGGLIKGDKSRHMRAILQGLQYGYAVAGIGYRLGNECEYPEMLKDCTTAVRFLKANAGKYGFDPQRMVVWGETHGAFLACMIGVYGGTGKYDDLSDGYDHYDSRVSGIIDYWSFTNFQDLLQVFKERSVNDPEPLAAFEKLFRASGQELEDKVASLGNPLNDIDGDEPPFYVLHSELDITIPREHSIRWYTALKEAGDDVTLEIVPNTEHSLPNYQRAEQIEGTFNFLHRILDR